MIFYFISQATASFFCTETYDFTIAKDHLKSDGQRSELTIVFNYLDFNEESHDRFDKTISYASQIASETSIVEIVCLFSDLERQNANSIISSSPNQNKIKLLPVFINAELIPPTHFLIYGLIYGNSLHCVMDSEILISKQRFYTGNRDVIIRCQANQACIVSGNRLCLSSIFHDLRIRSYGHWNELKALCRKFNISYRIYDFDQMDPIYRALDYCAYNFFMHVWFRLYNLLSL